MKTEIRHSYGVIPLRKAGDEIQILLIKQKHESIDYWTFPKGTPESGETPLETAVRETKEEVGIECDAIDTTKTFEDHFEFVREDVRIDKSVTYFIGRTKKGEAIPQNSEVDICLWLPLDQAEEKLTFPLAKKVLREIRVHLKTSRLFEAK